MLTCPVTAGLTSGQPPTDDRCHQALYSLQNAKSAALRYNKDRGGGGRRHSNADEADITGRDCRHSTADEAPKICPPDIGLMLAQRRRR